MSFRVPLIVLASVLLLGAPLTTLAQNPEEEVLPAMKEDEILLSTSGPAEAPEGWPSSVEALHEGLQGSIRAQTLPRALVFFLGRYEDGELAASYMSDVVEPEGETVRMNEAPRGDLLPGAPFSAGELLSPPDIFIPGGMFFPTEENEPGAPVERAEYMQAWDTELGDVEVDWERQQALVVVAMPYGEEDRLRARSRPFIIFLDAGR